MKNFCFAFCLATFIFYDKAFGSEAGMPQLNPKYWVSQVFWLILTFSIFYLIIWKIFLPKITNSIENRKSKTVNDINEAQKLKENAEKKLKEYNLIIENSHKEAKNIIENGRKKLEQDIKNKNKKFNGEIKKELISVEKEIQDLKKSSTEDVGKIAAEASGEIIKQVMDADVNKSNVSAVVEDLIKKKVQENKWL